MNRLSARRAAAVFLMVAAAAAALLVSAAPAAAHANLAVADPAPNSVLDEPPARIVIQFTEPLEPAFSQIDVLAADGGRVDNGDTVVDSTDPTVMSVSLPPLEDGTYTVVWKNVSTVDGHRVRGAYAFSIGEPISGAMALEAGGTPLLQSQLEPFARWLVILSGLTLAGGLAFRLLVLVAPPGAVASRLPAELNRLARRRVLLVVWSGLVVYSLASVWQLLLQAASTAEVSIFDAIGAPAVDLVSETGWGHAWAARVALAAGMGMVLAVPRGRIAQFRAGEAAVDLAGLALAGASLFTISWVSHAAGTAEIRSAALFSDYAHLLAAAVWVGGLISLAAALAPVLSGLRGAERRGALAAIVPRFSLVALVSAALLGITGLFSAWAQVTAWEAFVSPYGYTLLAKLLLLVPLLTLAAVNLLWIRPRLRRSDGASGTLRYLVAGEIALMALVVLTVGYLTALEPGRQVASRRQAEAPPTFEDVAEGAGITVGLEHAQTGPNSVTVWLVDHRGGPIENAADVSIRLSNQGADIPGDLLPASDTGGGVWVLADQLLSVSGVWQAEVVIRRPDAFDARTAFRFNVGSGTGAGSAAIAPAAADAAALLALEIAVAGLLLVGAGVRLGGWYVRQAAAVMVPGVAVTLVGIGMFASGSLFGGPAAVPLENPFPPTSESIASGHAAYGRACATCHGVAGLGDGPSAASLSSPPADLTVHVPLHADDDLFQFIRDGISGTPMRPLRDALTDEEIWHVVNYIKTLPERVAR